MKYEIQSISVWALVKVGFFVNLAIGFLFGIFSTLVIIPIIQAFMTLAGGDVAPYDASTAFGLLFFLPFVGAIFAAFFNTLFMVAVALCYNLVAKIVGGLEFTFAERPTHPILVVAPHPAVVSPASSQQSSDQEPIPPPPPPFRPDSIWQAAPAVTPAAADSLSTTTPHHESEPFPYPEPENGAPVVEPHTEPDEEGPRQDNP